MTVLQEALAEKKSAVVQKWFEAALVSYHEQVRDPLRKVKAQFANPVGFDLARGLDGLYDALLKGVISEEISTFLDAIVRIRAVQEFAPSEALAFLLQIKRIVREELGKDRIAGAGMAEALAAFDSAADDLALYAFDLYMRCREKIYELKAQEARDMTFRLLQRAQNLPDSGT